MKDASVRQPLFIEPSPSPCHPDRSEAERRDLRFRGPSVRQRSCPLSHSLLFVIPSEAEGSAVHSIGHQSKMETLLSPCHPDRSDLRFRGP
jgi:hypothetical protein